MDPSCLQLFSHYLAERADGCTADVRDLKQFRMQFIAGTHAADQWNLFFLCPLDHGQLRCHCINGIDDIIRTDL